MKTDSIIVETTMTIVNKKTHKPEVVEDSKVSYQPVVTVVGATIPASEGWPQIDVLPGVGSYTGHEAHVEEGASGKKVVIDPTGSELLSQAGMAFMTGPPLPDDVGDLGIAGTAVMLLLRARSMKFPRSSPKVAEPMQSRTSSVANSGPISNNAAQKLVGQARRQLQETVIGRQTLGLTEGASPTVRQAFDSGTPPAPGVKGESHFDGTSRVFLANNQGKGEAAESIIHEASHAIGLGGQGTQAQELIPELRARAHTAALSGKKLQLRDVMEILVWQRTMYPELSAAGTRAELAKYREQTNDWNALVAKSLGGR
jgi:hypothetical protein